LQHYKPGGRPAENRIARQEEAAALSGMAPYGRIRFISVAHPALCQPYRRRTGDATNVTRNQGSSASLIELALIIVLIAIIVMAILLIVGEDLRALVVNTIQQFIPSR
jgi:hypothetical protein